MEFIPMLVLLATVKKVIDFVRYAKAGDVNGIVVQLLAWLSGVALVALAAHTAWSQQLEFGGITLHGMGFASQVLAGIALGSAASLAQDALRAADNSQSAAVPALIPPAPDTPISNDPLA